MSVALLASSSLVFVGALFAARRQRRLLSALERVAEVVKLPDDVQEWEESDGSVRVVEVVNAQRVRDAIGEALS